MDGHTSERSSYSFEENMGLLAEKSMSDTDSETGGSVDVETDLKTPRWGLPATTAPLAYLRSIHWRLILVRLAVSLLPIFLQGRHAREQFRTAKLHPTAYLDGIRGLAALFVYFCHYSYQAFTVAEGWGCDVTNYNLLKLPFLRLWYQGPAAVCVFFVISGYALSYRPLKLIRSHDMSGLASTMGSLTFRRWFRLFIPPIISTFMVLLLVQAGAYDATHDFASSSYYNKNVLEPHPERWASAYEQFWDWAWNMFQFIHVWDWTAHGGSTGYDVHLWTISVEYRCSMFLFLVIFATSQLRTLYRFATVLTVTWYTYRNSRWELVLFLCGMLIAEVDLIRGAHGQVPLLPQEERQPVKTYPEIKTAIWSALGILSLYLLCQPDSRGEITPGWIWMTAQIPEWWGADKYRYWQSAGAVLFILAVSQLPPWQKLFNTAVVQYFGKISYAIYLVHGPAMHVIGYRWEAWVYGWTGTYGNWYNVGFALGASLCVPTVIWCADIFWRLVDIPTVRFAKWLESKLADKSG
ncbi:acyltransferase family-domain-containing protein [Emericellopsis atlantica]|uniref:Acyltransferase family-domain-containing protein n=1 Tax=Emericellopsis atlantica TaxID=2614577 RepID=A0A9P7ZMT4_9HYPO|nr:acyltransferase family-domain-containing protein [Emericellopsis atlantica]KAG9254587.1 acyltransferase family-domain-containing protein [Emericellopsis atlantica]